MKLSAKGGQAKPVAANATGFNPWKFTFPKSSFTYLHNVNFTAFKFDSSFRHREQCVVFAYSYVVAGEELCTALTHDNRACLNVFAAE
jgi:hypothetical protein